jgi:hypothetical protein
LDACVYGKIYLDCSSRKCPSSSFSYQINKFHLENRNTLHRNFGIYVFTFFFAVFDVHDYYLVTSFSLPILIFIALVDLIEKKQWMTNWKGKLAISGVIISLWGYATYKSGIEQNFRYFTNKYGVLIRITIL